MATTLRERSIAALLKRRQSGAERYAPEHYVYDDDIAYLLARIDTLAKKIKKLKK